MNLGIVIIGRNEGERLLQCLRSAHGADRTVVYVDSGSTDGSAPAARDLGAHVVDLDMSQPFTAARARNAGYAALRKQNPNIEYVQFVDGDCEIVDGWLEAGESFLEHNPKAAVACGRRRERHPEKNAFTSLADEEWNTPIGKTEACGGDAMIRGSAFDEIGGYDSSLIAGEEPELCLRLREKGWEIYRLDHEMTLHDIGISRFSQWWSRSARAGHAYAEVSAMHAKSDKRIWKAETWRAIMWSSFLPLAVLLALFLHPAFLLALLVYLLQIARLTLRGRDWRHAVLLVAGKFAEAQGVLRYWFKRLTGKSSAIIEYKTS